jgi:hypothetical protein
MVKNNEIPEEIRSELFGVLYLLFSLKNIDEDYLMNINFKKYMNKRLDLVKKALDWALEHQDYDFFNILPNTPQKYKNHDLIQYLKIIKRNISQ